MFEMMSPREEVAQALAETCIFGALNDSYGVDKTKVTDKKGKTYWSVTFCKARVLDGVIQVYSPRFILVKWQTTFGHLPHRGQKIFKSEHEAKDFICRNFVIV